MPHADKKNFGSSLRQRVAVAAKMTAKEQENISSAKSSRRAQKSSRMRDESGSSKKSARSDRRSTQGSSSRSRKDATKRGSSNRAADSSRTSQRDKNTVSKDGRSERDGRTRSASLGFITKVGDFLMGLSLGRRIVVSVVCVLVLAVVLLYPLAQDYYKSFRDEQRVQAQVEAVAERNSAIEKENSDLETDEGIENQARKELGWVKDGDQSAVVTNAGDSSSSDSKLPSRVDTDSIEAPHTWYYDILDVVFFVDTRSDS